MKMLARYQTFETVDGVGYTRDRHVFGLSASEYDLVVVDLNKHGVDYVREIVGVLPCDKVYVEIIKFGTNKYQMYVDRMLPLR